VTIERSNTHVTFKHGTTEHKIIAWPHEGKLQVTFDRASRLILGSPKQTLVVDIGEVLPSLGQECTIYKLCL